MGGVANLPSKGPVYALHAMQAATELSMLDALTSLRSPDPDMLPALHALLATRPVEEGPVAPLPEAAARAVASCTLNASQLTVVARAVQALQGAARGPSRVRPHV